MTDLNPFVPSHGERADRSCGFSADGKNYCGRTPTWHVSWWPPPRTETGHACDEHMAVIQRRWMYDDRHPTSSDCGMPGSFWSYRDECCHAPDDIPALTAEQVEPVRERANG